jgi:hypothetical protein
MVELTPGLIGLIALCVVCVTIVQYWVVPPMALDKADGAAAVPDATATASAAEGGAQYHHYGIPNGEFDWCEPNFEFSHLVAEPINTLSGALFFLPAIAGFRHHRAKDLSLSTKLNLVFITWIGLGTILFHATLRYTAQLLDELPILYVMVSGNYMLLARARRAGIPWLGWTLAAWALAITVGILGSPQHTIFHEAARGTMSVTFGVMFVHIFAGVSSTLISLRKRAEEEARAAVAAASSASSASASSSASSASSSSSSPSAVEVMNSGQQLFQQTFMYILAGLACWIIDNGFCDHLHPGGLYVRLESGTVAVVVRCGGGSIFLDAGCGRRRGAVVGPSRARLSVAACARGRRTSEHLRACISRCVLACARHSRWRRMCQGRDHFLSANAAWKTTTAKTQRTCLASFRLAVPFYIQTHAIWHIFSAIGYVCRHACNHPIYDALSRRAPLTMNGS